MLSRHIVLKQFLLIFGQRLYESITGFDDLIQRFRLLTAALEAAFARVDRAEVKVF